MTENWEQNESNLAAVLLCLVQDMAGEMNRPHSGELGLDSSLSKDVGLDSLGRVELLLRVERKFGVVLPDSLLATAEIPRDILRAVAAGEVVSQRPAPEITPGPARGNPINARTLLEALEWHRQTHPERLHVQLWEGGEQVTYAELAHMGSVVAGSLQERGVRPGETVALMLPTSIDYLAAFVGVLHAGAIPVPVYPPFRPAEAQEHLSRQAGILRNANARLLITTQEVKPVARMLRAKTPALREVAVAADLLQGTPAPPRPVSPEAPAFIQYTSGSTGNPKGVVLTHANLLANVRAMGNAVAASASDVFVSWLPLYHDMGLIGAWMGSLYFGMPLFLLSPAQFLIKPVRWLRAISDVCGSISPAPNFAYELCVRKIEDSELASLDLRSWRLALNGAEPVSAATIDAFTNRFKQFGFRDRAMTPVYGLAESSVGLAFPPLERGPRVDVIKRLSFQRSGNAEPASATDTAALRFVACGRPLPDHEIRVVDHAGRELPERRQGRIEFRGPSATRGYFHNEVETRKLFHGTWLDTGDVGYVAEGDLFVTGRMKDLITRAGRNVYPEELEEAVGAIPGIRKGCVAVFAARDVSAGTEKVVVMAEVREGARPADFLRQAIVERSLALTGSPPEDIVLVPPHTVPKTSSGKIRRSASRELYERGVRAKPRGMLAVGLALWQLRALFLRSWDRSKEYAYAAYAWLLFAAFAVPVLVGVAVVPRKGWRRRFVHGAARWMLRAGGIRLLPVGLAEAAEGTPKIWVANHASYLDGLVLEAVLPLNVTYVAKRELLRRLIPRVFLRRIGTAFVTRDDPQRGSAEVELLINRTRKGEPILIFPEGGFGRAPVLRPFHMGAFQVAAETGSAVVPIAIRGTRAILRSGSKFPRRSAVSIVFGKPITPQGAGWNAARELRDQAFEQIRLHSREPASVQ